MSGTVSYMSWKKSFFALFFAEGIAIAGFSISMPVIPLFFQELGVHSTSSINFWNGITQVGSALGLMIFAPIWGTLADQYGRRTMLLRAMFGGAILVGLMAFVREPWQLFVLRTMQGCVTGTIAAATVLTTSIVPDRKTGFCLGLLQSSVFVGSSIGPLFGGVISDFWGHRSTFIVTAVFLFMAGVLVSALVKESFVPKKSGERIITRIMPKFSVISGDKGIIALFLMIFSIHMAGSVVNPILPLFIQSITPDVKILGTATGLILGISAMSSAGAAAIIGRIGDRKGYWRILAFCMAGSVLFYIPQGFARNWHELLALRVFDGIFMGGTMPAVNALITRRTHTDKRGAVFGLSTSVASMGMAIGPALGATVASIWGYPWVFFITAGIIAAAGFTIGLVRNGRIREKLSVKKYLK